MGTTRVCKVLFTGVAETQAASRAELQPAEPAEHPGEFGPWTAVDRKKSHSGDSPRNWLKTVEKATSQFCKRLRWQGA